MQSRAFISAIIGESYLAEGASIAATSSCRSGISERNLQTFLPIMFSKSSELTKKWISIVENSDEMMTVMTSQTGSIDLPGRSRSLIHIDITILSLIESSYYPAFVVI